MKWEWDVMEQYEIAANTLWEQIPTLYQTIWFHTEYTWYCSNIQFNAYFFIMILEKYSTQQIMEEFFTGNYPEII